jgi:hypothetical protein
MFVWTYKHSTGHFSNFIFKLWRHYKISEYKISNKT